ncbi:regulatory protein RecX [Geoalkalibacter halelectricus]|uniref:Regulatory protein RecX n=1 Tax=Geoalkalibacter halelectricus TaxID=2847045 RepID=A0ABY5ZPP0_9BACT|nr:regulatory protein RecX [Geoalkalibacter halelectricus]MDO3377440.1 recombination regulator RecX [Geoalkalibacter halelectricus]UWZ80799.1 recombination regulator RecX [Geoalkalibacter halelectricus]
MTRASSASDPLALAVRLLSARDRSAAELRAALQRRGVAAELIEQVLDRCRELGYLDDQRFARERARALLRSGRAAGTKILLDLRRRGIDDDLAAAALSAAEAEQSPAQTLRELCARRFADFVYEHADAGERRRVVTFLQRRGFSLDQIMAILRQERDC